MNKQHIYFFSYISHSGDYCGFFSWGFENKRITSKNLNDVITEIENKKKI
jgi:hypothetical protein